MSDSNSHVGRGAAWLCLLLFCGANYATAGAPPVVSTSARRSGRARNWLTSITIWLIRTVPPSPLPSSYPPTAEPLTRCPPRVSAAQAGQRGHARLQQTNHLGCRRGLERALFRQRPLPRHRR